MHVLKPLTESVVNGKALAGNNFYLPNQCQCIIVHWQQQLPDTQSFLKGNLKKLFS